MNLGKPCSVRLTEGLGVGFRVLDNIGALGLANRILDGLDRNEMNVEYFYGLKVEQCDIEPRPEATAKDNAVVA